ncbi:GH92 family glycosyl hydrolase [Luteolibacter soli]|uniref:GH92 family glycosyl hydrolase n=1 Tax=Luteolibacter soli TaxID=3135280 RepID=A0ABU9AXC5_9BACT
MIRHLGSLALVLFGAFTGGVRAEDGPADLVNPLLGTATIWEKSDVGFTPTHRTWGAEVFPGSSLPNAMVQLSPVTQFHSGSGYQYEDTVIQAFTHTCKGHWNLCNVPFLPVTGEVKPKDYGSPYSHKNESAKPGYYQVYLERYGVNVELTSTLRCGYHKYTFKEGEAKKLLVDLSMANERVRERQLTQDGERAFTGYQQTGERIYFYARTNHRITAMESVRMDEKEVTVLQFENEAKPLEIQVGFSYVSVEGAKQNLEKEIGESGFNEVRERATSTWNELLSKIKVTGGTDRQKGLFYSCLYRSFLWPALRSDVNGDFPAGRGAVANKGFHYYTDPSLWDDYRNKLVLLGMLSPKVANDVISSMIQRGQRFGFMPTFFHGDHAAPFIAGSYLRGLRDYDVKEAYRLLLRNATVEGGPRPFIKEYAEKGYIADNDIAKPEVGTKDKAGVTKTLEYAYDDYSLALLAKELGDEPNRAMLTGRTGSFKNVFDASTGFMRGKLADGSWVKNFDPQYPYYEYMYREANAWQSAFFAPHDVAGLIGLYPGKEAFEKKLDELFTIPWNGMEAYNISGFIGQYCHGNQPDHSYPHLYTFIGKPEKSQAIIDQCLDRFYDMGKDKLSYAGMDDAGEMSSWYVFNALGLYTFSPADPEYLVSVPIFDKVEFKIGDSPAFTIRREGKGRKLTGVSYDSRKVEGHFISHEELKKGKELVIETGE